MLERKKKDEKKNSKVIFVQKKYINYSRFIKVIKLLQIRQSTKGKNQQKKIPAHIFENLMVRNVCFSNYYAPAKKFNWHQHMMKNVK